MAESDLDTIKSLEKLWQKINEGITKAVESTTKADETLQQVREVQGEVSEVLNFKSEVESLLRDVQKQGRKIQKLIAHAEVKVEDLQRLEKEVNQAMYEKVGNPEILLILREDIQKAIGDLAEFNESRVRLEKIAESRQNLLEKQLESSAELMVKIESELVEQAMSGVENALEKMQVEKAQFLEQLASLGETIRQQDVLKLRLEKMEKEQLRQSGLLIRGIWAILVVLGGIGLAIALLVGKLIVLLP